MFLFIDTEDRGIATGCSCGSLNTIAQGPPKGGAEIMSQQVTAYGHGMA